MNNFIVGGISFVIGGTVGFFISKKLIVDKLAAEFENLVDEEVALQLKIEREYLERRLFEIDNAERTVLPENPIPTRNSYMTTKTIYNQKGDLNTIVKEKYCDPDGSDEEDYSEDEDNVLRDPSGMSEEDHLNPDCSTTHDMEGIDRSLPYLITDEEYYNEFEHHMKESVVYYVEDDTLVEESTDEIIELEEIDESVGWDFFPILEAGNPLVWVRNERLQMDYEISVMHDSYSRSRYGAAAGVAANPREQYEKRKRLEEDE